jgi:hypothetical protein
MTSTRFNVPYSYLYRKCIVHIHPLYFLHLPSHSTSALLLAWPVLHSCPSLFKCLSVVQRSIRLCILLVDILCLSQCSTFPLFFLTFFPHPVLLTSFWCILLCLVPTQMWCVSLLFILYHSFLLFLIPWSPLPVPLLEACSLSLSPSLSIYPSIHTHTHTHTHTHIW